MQKQLMADASQNAKRRKLRTLWRRAVRVLACVVVFCTTYALILPAITMEKTKCGLEEHTHSETCYQQLTTQAVTGLTCAADTLGVHTHTEGCYDAEQNLICGLADFVVHQHDASCCDEAGNLVCTLPEVKEHTHSEECYQVEPAPVHAHEASCYTRGGLICSQEESQGHTHGEACTQITQICQLTVEPHVHTDACYTQLECQLPEDENHTHTDACTGKVLICTLTEQPHVHTDACFQTTDTCTLEETEGHTHTDECYEAVLSCGMEEGQPMGEAVKTLICQKEVIQLHTHDDSCYETYVDEAGAQQKRLICTKTVVQAHTHGESCFQTREVPLDNMQTLTCTNTAQDHTHTPMCYGTWKLICGKEEHTHTEECKAEEETPQLGEVPECDCHAGALDWVALHSDSCAKKAFFRTLSEEKSAADIYALWDQIPEDGREYILTHLFVNSWQYGDKYKELKALIAQGPQTPGESAELKTELEGKASFAVAGQLPEGAALQVADPQYTEEKTFTFINPNIWDEVRNYWVYDIEIQVDGQAHQPETPVQVSVTSENFVVGEDELFCVAHLDEETGEVLSSTYVEVVDNTVTFEADGFSPYLFYTVDAAVEGGERIWSTEWMDLRDSGYFTYWEQFLEPEEPEAEPAGLLSMFGLRSNPASAQQIESEGGTRTNAEDAVTVSKTIAGTELENVFDITLTVDTNTEIKTVFQEPDMAVVLVMDISNTMKGVMKDSTKTRYQGAMEAAELFVDEFTQNNEGASRIGYVAFNTNGHEICAMQACSTPAQATAFKNKMRQNTGEIINAEGYGSSNTRYTNIEAGLKQAEAMLDKMTNQNKYIIFLSDGLPTTYIKSGTTGYAPVSDSGTKGANGVFYDALSDEYCAYGTNYSDKGASRAADAAAALKADGVTIFSVGVGVDSFKAHNQSMNSTEYINDQLDRGARKGYYATASNAVATIDNNCANRNSFAVGDITMGTDVFQPWLKDTIGSGHYYLANDPDTLKKHYADIFAKLTEMNIEASASLWTVDDPIPLVNGSPETVEFIGLWNQDGTKLLGDQLSGEYGGAENTTSFNASQQEITWDLKNSKFTHSTTDGITTYHFSQRYRVRLQNENLDPAFAEGTVYFTNDTTLLNYQTLVTVNGVTTVSEKKTLEFPIPSVQGYLADLTFRKIDSLGDPVVGAEFTLTHDTASCGLCRGDQLKSVTIGSYTAQAVAIDAAKEASGTDGYVTFHNIPSGHKYILEETLVPPGYASNGCRYQVTVAYDAITVTVTNKDGSPGTWDDTITNITAYRLPQTGGTGTHLYTLGGLLLMLMAASLLLYHSRKNRKEEFTSF